MDKVIRFFKFIFYILIVFLVIVSIFPGSLLGFLVFGDISRQPNLIDNPYYQVLPWRFYSIGSAINHLVTFFLISLIGFSIYFKNSNFQLLVYIFFSFSIILEVIQIIIPNRAFEIYDVSANFSGVLLAYLVVKIYITRRKK